MQTIDFIQTSKWIVAQFTTETKETFFTSAPFRRRVEQKEPRIDINPLIQASHEVAVVIDKLKAHPLAPDILRAFGLEELLDLAFPVEIIKLLAATQEPAGPRIPPQLVDLWDRWDKFTSCIQPIEQIAIPREVANEQNFDDVLTIELRYDHNVNPQAETLLEVLTDTVQLYGSIARAYGRNDFPPLRIIYADSGSSIRIDLTGLGEIIREFKELLVDLWNRFRHRKAEDYEHNTNALLVGLKVAGVIELHRQQGLINDEDAARYTRIIIESGTSLFKAGALPREVPRVEVLSNQTLLQDIQQKLLPPAPDKESATNEENKNISRQSKKKRPRKPSRKAHK